MTGKRSQTTAPTADLPFEEAQARLDALVTKLEGSELPLEDSLALYEEGVTLVRRLRELLDAAERRVVQIVGDRELPLVDGE
jgi:exodeoxyribonuclease VII small subunit